MRMHAMRLRQGQDLRQSIIELAVERDMSSVVLSCVGSLSAVCVRMAGAKPEQQDVRTLDGPFEIVSLTGTVTPQGQAHLHISVSDTEGKVTGGHLKDGSFVETTAELVLASDDAIEFSRETDEQTGFDELVIEEAR